MRVNQRVKDQSRRALLDAAALAFAREGYHRANVDRISEGAGLAKGTVYNYFPSKRAIFDGVLLEACRLAAESADAVPDSAPTRRRLEAFVQGNLAWARSNEAHALLLARELVGGGAEARELILAASEPCVAKVAAILRSGSQRGELERIGPPEDLALTFIVLANAMLLQALRPGAGWPAPEALAPTVTGLFLDGIATERAGPAR